MDHMIDHNGIDDSLGSQVAGVRVAGRLRIPSSSSLSSSPSTRNTRKIGVGSWFALGIDSESHTRPAMCDPNIFLLSVHLHIHLHLHLWLSSCFPFFFLVE